MENQDNRKRLGFVMFENDFIDALIVTNILTERETKVILLILRLTVGCRSPEAKLRQVDFQAAGIRDGHIKQVLEGLKSKGLVKEDSGMYRLADDLFERLQNGAEKANDRLRWLVGQHLVDPRTGKRRYTNSVRKYTPIREGKSYQNGSDLDRIEDQVISGSVTDSEPPTNILTNTVKNTVTDSTNGNLKSFSSKKETTDPLVDPHTFKPEGPAEGFALSAWQMLEPDKPESFKFYLDAFKSHNLYLLLGIAHEIRKDPEVKNKGALFVSRVKELDSKEDMFDEPF